MNRQDEAQFEEQLRRLRPAALPTPLQRRLEAALPAAPHQPPHRRADVFTSAWRWLQWLVPTAAAAAMLVIVLARGHREAGRAAGSAGDETSALEATEVVIDRELVQTFDAVATLPGGEPVRLRCRQWMEAFTLRNPAGGWEVEQRRPRLEIIPVRFETY